MFFRSIVAGFILIFVGCSQSSVSSSDPKRRLTEYLSKSFSIQSVSERHELESFLTGDTRNRLAAWSDDQFEAAFIQSKRKFQKLLFRETKQLDENRVNITYELTYLDESKESPAKITQKKLCTLTREKGTWYIREVRNIKELVEYRDEMSLP